MILLYLLQVPVLRDGGAINAELRRLVEQADFNRVAHTVRDDATPAQIREVAFDLLALADRKDIL